MVCMAREVVSNSSSPLVIGSDFQNVNFIAYTPCSKQVAFVRDQTTTPCVTQPMMPSISDCYCTSGTPSSELYAQSVSALSEHSPQAVVAQHTHRVY